MSEDTNHPMNDPLKAYAKARRDQHGPAGELSPFARRSLQEEVERVYGRIQAEARESFWEKFLPKLGFAAAGFAVFMVALTVLDMKNAFDPEVTPLAGQGSMEFAHREYLAPFSPSADPESASTAMLFTQTEPAASQEMTEGGASAAEGGSTLALNFREPSRFGGELDESRAESDRFSIGDTLYRERLLAEADGLTTRSQQVEEGLARQPENEAVPAAETRSNELARKEATSFSDEVAPDERGQLAVLGDSGTASAALGIEVQERAPSRFRAITPASNGVIAAEEAGSRAVAPPPAPTTPRAAPPQEIPARPAAPAPPAKIYELVQVDTRAQYRRNLQSPPPPSILSQFRIEVSGANVRVVDADGSIYEGEVVARTPAQADASNLKDSTADAARRDAPRESELAEEGAGFEFHVTGVNRSLNQPVTLQGLLVPASIAANGRVDFDSNQKKDGTGARGIAAQTTAASVDRVQARVNVGGTMQFNVEAVTKAQP
jgi:hypothetical protein